MNTSRHASLKNWMAAAFSIFLVAAVSATPITAANVYWVEQLVVNTTLKTSVDGNTVSTIPESDMSIPHSLVATGDAIYWLDINGQSSTQAMVKKSALDGSNPSTLYTYSNSGAVVGFAGLSICGNTMFWSDPIMQVIYRAGLDGSSPTKIVTSGLTLPRTTAADAQYVYWANYDSGTIERALHDGSGRTLVASSAVFGESLLGIDKIALSNDGYIYWVRGGFGQL